MLPMFCFLNPFMGLPGAVEMIHAGPSELLKNFMTLKFEKLSFGEKTKKVDKKYAQTLIVVVLVVVKLVGFLVITRNQ